MILAADPGLSGAFALYGGDTLEVRAMPTVKRVVAGKDRNVIDDHGVLDFVLGLAMLEPIRVFIIENVHGIKGQSASASFNFGYGFGVICTAGRAAGLPIEFVAPATWKGAMKAPKDKTASRSRASDLLPQFAHLWPRAGDDGKAEAAMLALYGERYLK